MKKVYHLANCDTCQRIIATSGVTEKGFDFQNIKTEKITPEQLDEMAALSGSYESLFSRRSLKYKELGLKDQPLSESDYRRLILEEYTFLKRPVTIIGKQIFIGNDKKTVAALTAAVGQLK